jgi:hypothetical protein
MTLFISPWIDACGKLQRLLQLCKSVPEWVVVARKWNGMGGDVVAPPGDRILIF